MIFKQSSLAGCLLLLLAGCSGAAGPARPPWAVSWPGLPVTEVRAIGDGCVRDPAARPGEQVMVVANTSAAPLELRIVLADSPAAVFELEPVAPATARAATARLAGGRYRYACYFEEQRVMYSEPFEVVGAPGDQQAVAAVSMQDLNPVAREYEHWVAGLLPQLRQQTAAIAVGGAAGKRSWTAAHRLYETLGAAYDAFGDQGQAVEDGFASVEDALWRGADAADASRTLTEAVDALADSFPEAEVDPLALGLRAHEIVEDSIDKTLSGRDDHGSHTALATLAANLDGVTKLLDLLDPLLRTRYSALPALRAELVSAQALVSGHPPRQRLNAVFSQLAEDLAPVAAICDIRRRE
ncbi:EfeM/EfeO family lipoprotein [Segniliparus rotundus]|uniref:EfeM/EfeO family lipoprotein n=1 Tax=Segniliparus rotundus TaxID=286802 RepID=UPI000311DE91|nr:EfeM/EfeO family lipoprotein [Segniliparus rotundus]